MRSSSLLDSLPPSVLPLPPGSHLSFIKREPRGRWYRGGVVGEPMRYRVSICKGFGRALQLVLVEVLGKNLEVSMENKITLSPSGCFYLEVQGSDKGSLYGIRICILWYRVFGI